MKLFTKYNRLNITATICIFIIGSCTFYFVLKYILINELDQALYTEEQEVTEYAQEHNALPEILHTKDQYISYSLVPVLPRHGFYDIRAPYNDGISWFREIRFGISVAGKNYAVSVSKPLGETQKLLQLIILVTVVMIGLILLVGYQINRTVLNNLWRPFYNAIEKVKTYKVSEKDPLKLSETDIDEFSLLNQSIQAMAERVQHDYQALKEFTGYAAHEMQTPLAIIRSRLDMLMQDEYMLAHSPSHISEIEQAVHKLSRLYQALLLLTKVENRQFVLNEYVAVHAIIEYKFIELVELSENKNLTTVLNIEPLSITFHRQLMEIMIGNLLYNAIRYNTPGGSIEINLDEKALVITNTSPLSRLDNDRLFQRFYRHPDVVEEGNGLGLSIVKQICDTGGFKLSYDYMEGKHKFSVAFVN